MTESKNWTKFPTLFSLYIAQSVPMSFFSTVVPVIMRQENYSLESIGLLQLVKLPWVIKFFWAPLVDNHAKNSKDLKRWIVFSELFYAVIISSIAFLSLQTDFKLIVALMVVAFTASATQDIATDAFSILILKKDERGVGNSMQTAGSFVGALLGTGVLLIAYSFFGWSAFLFMLAGFIIFALVPLYLYKVNRTVQKKPGYRVTLPEIGRFFRVPGIPKRVLILAFFYSGFIGILTMLKPFLVDLGYNIKEIGFMSGIVGTSVATGSALLVGAFIKKAGRNRIMIILTLLGISAALYFWWIAGITPSLAQIYLGICLVWAAYGSSSVIIYTTSMDVVRPGAAGTDFTMQIVITHISSLAIAVLSGKVAGGIGYKGLFGVEVLMGILTLLVILYAMPKKRKIKAPTFYRINNKFAGVTSPMKT
ncbi:MAG: MFS transporter [Bacteroidales bacterium]